MGDMQGYLLVQTAPHQDPREYCVTLHGNVLSYARTPGEAALDLFILEGRTAVTPDGTQDIVVATGGGRPPLVLHAQSPAERNRWLAVLQRAAGSTSPARRLSRRIVVDINDTSAPSTRSSIAPPRTAGSRRPALSLDMDDDVAPPPLAASTIKASTVAAGTGTTGGDKGEGEKAVDVSDSPVEDEGDLLKTCIDFSSRVVPPAEAAPRETRPAASNPFLDDQDEIAPPDDALQHQVLESTVVDAGKGEEVVSTVDVDDIDPFSSFIVPPPSVLKAGAPKNSSAESAPPAQEPESPRVEEDLNASSICIPAQKQEKKEEQHCAETLAVAAAPADLPPAAENPKSVPKEEEDKQEQEKKEEKEKDETPQPSQPTGSDTFMLPGTVEDSMISAPSTNVVSSFIIPSDSADAAKTGAVAESFVVPPAEGDRSYLFSSVCESRYGTESVIVPTKTHDNPLMRQFQQMQEHPEESIVTMEPAKGVGATEAPKTAAPAGTTKQDDEEKQKAEKAEKEKEKEPEWKTTNGSYVEVKDPAELRLLLKWGLPSGATGIFADGIMIDFDADVPPHWSLNPHGRIRLAMTKQETLERLRAKIVEAQERGDTAMLNSLVQRHREVAAQEEPEMTCFHFCDDLKLCFRAGEWVVMNKLPPAEPDPGEWLEHVSESLGKFFTAAGKSLRDFLGRMATAANEDLSAFAGKPLFVSSSSASASSTPASAPTPTAAPSAPAPAPAPTTAPVPTSKAPEPTTEKNPREAMLADLERDVGTLLRAVSSGASAEERAKLADDAQNPRVAVLVRAYLCTDLARLAGDGFRAERLFGAYHLWDWVESYGARRAVAAPSVEALALRKAVATVAACRYDKSASFRAFVCLALSAQRLAPWLDVMVADADRMARFFAPTALLRTPDALAAVRTQLARLSDVPFALSLDFEARGGFEALSRSASASSAPAKTSAEATSTTSSSEPSSK